VASRVDLEVITAQNAALSDEVTAVNILGQRMATAVLLIEAFGGVGTDRVCRSDRMPWKIGYERQLRNRS
jgi:hypothetical protein